MMRVGLVGGTGREGRGLAVRWAKAGHRVFIGSRDRERGVSSALDLSQTHRLDITGGDNLEAVRDADLVVLCVPYSAHQAALTEIKPHLEGRILIDITVPLKPPRVREVHLPPGQAAALEAQALLGADARVVSALHHISSSHLDDEAHPIDCDVLVCSDDDAARDAVIRLIEDLGVRALDAGPLRNVVALEALTPVLLYLNRKYRSAGTGIRITGIPE